MPSLRSLLAVQTLLGDRRWRTRILLMVLRFLDRFGGRRSKP